ncbi:MAG: tetratricopeptide repeat protein [Acidobacteria bacterium]|nr:tetratricopeptide repeat protein [Acidobacteriota bacterium]
MSKARPRRRTKRTAVEPEGYSIRGQSSDSTQRPASGSPLSIAKSPFSERALWVCLALIAINVAVYAQVWHYGLVNYDDPNYVGQNPHVSDGLSWHGVSWAFTTGYFVNWHPLTWLSYMLDVQIYGLNPGGHHLTNLLLHIASTILLFGLLHRMNGALGRSAFVAGLFAVHPLHLESVAWVAERKDVLSTLFWMLTMWAYVRYAHQPGMGRYVLVLLLFALGLMAKPMLVTLPFVLLLLDYWPLGRVTLGTDLPGRSGLAPLRDQRSVRLHLVWEKLPLLALAIASSIVTFVVQRKAVAGLDAIPLDKRVANALVSYVAYIGKMLWPTRLAAYYPYPQSLPGWWVVGAILGLIGVSVMVIRAARRHPYLPVGWLWYLGTLVPVIGLVQVGGQSMADRYTYVPLIGLFIIVAWGGPDLLVRWPHRSIALTTAAALVISACTITAWGQVRYWENSATFWERALEVTTGNDIAHYSLGTFLAGQGRVEEAIAHYSEALRIKPAYAEAHFNLGNALRSQGKVEEAIAHYSETLRIMPEHAEAHNNLGAVLVNQGKLGEAIAHYSEALRIKPEYAEAHYNLGNALASQGRIEEAIAHYSEALRIKPEYVEAHINLGAVLVNQGKLGEAIAHYSEALRIKPAYAEAHNNLGAVLMNQGRVEEAIAQFSEAARIKPEYADARNNLGFALAKRGRIDEAIHEFSEARRIAPRTPKAGSALDVLRNRDKRVRPGTP